MSDPLVSFIIPAYNQGGLLAATLADLLAQDYPAKEIIVVDDGSTDDTAEVCARFPVFYHYQENRGPAAARNFGAAQCRGELLVFHDQDDLCPPGSLRARVIHWQSEPDSHCVIGRLRRFCERAPGDIEFIESEEEASHYLCMGAAMVRRRAFEQLSGLDASLFGSDDTDFYLRAREAGMKLKLIPEICLFYRRHPGNITHNLDKSDKNLLSVLHMAMQRRRMLEGKSGK